MGHFKAEPLENLSHWFHFNGVATFPTSLSSRYS